MLYHYKVGIFSGVLASLTSLIVYITGPQNPKLPQIRVLYISYSDHSSVRRTISDSSPFVYDDSVQILEASEDGSVIIDRDEWELELENEGFFQNNIVLECTASFPITWKYSGFGSPSVTEENVRIHGDLNDTSTFSFMSLLNLMPVTVKTTGKYICIGESNETFRHSASINIFVPGEATFLIDYDTTIESHGEDHISIPCPVTNLSANISLYFKNQIVSHDNNLYTYDPKLGFDLTPKFVEEQSEPWGEFFCKYEETGEKSGVITIQPAKGLIVNAVPESSTVLLSKESSSENPEEKFKFVCQAKEEITLKFLKMVKNPMVQYEYNSSSNFPFSAYTEVDTKQFRNLSRIYCRTVRHNEDLHSWKVLFLTVSLRFELMDFHYDTSREDFACCSPSNKKARLTHLHCNSVSECRIKGHCLLPGHKCQSDAVTVLPERAGCVRYKLTSAGDEGQSDRDFSRRRGYNDNGKEGAVDAEDKDKVALVSGLLQCSIEGKVEEKAYFAVRSNGENGSSINTVAGQVSSASNGIFKKSLSGSNNDLKIMEMHEKKISAGRKRLYVCKGAKYFLALGFVWQTVWTDNEIKYHVGRDLISGPWIKSQIRLDLISKSSRSSSRLKRIYCIAPVWNSEDGDWMNVKLDVD